MVNSKKSNNDNSTANLNDPLRKAFLIGLGATMVTWEKIQEVAEDLMDVGEMNQKELTKFANDLKDRAQKEKDQFEKSLNGFESKLMDTVEIYVESAVKSLGLVTQRDLDALRKEFGGKASSPSAAATQTAPKKSKVTKKAPTRKPTTRKPTPKKR